MERIVLRHLQGSKANQVEEFPLAHFRELVLGRDPSSTVKYDPDRDDLVGRQHARISQQGSEFLLEDLSSRNGTFVNRQRVTGTVKLKPGDSVQLGQNGPEFVFDLEPRPQQGVPATRVAASANGVAATRVPGAPVAANVPATGAAQGAANGAVGKATVERMIADTKKKSNTMVIVVGGALVVVVLAAVAIFAAMNFLSKRELQGEIGKVAAGAAMKPAEVVKSYGKAVVQIEASWRLISPNGGLVYHQYLPNQGSDGQPLVNNGLPYVPAYVQMADGSYEPYLSYDGNKFSVAIGGAHTGSGFGVSNEGFILTNRHVAAAWKTQYNFPPNINGAVIFGADKRTIIGKTERMPNVKWVPAETKQEMAGRFEGRNDRLDVVFPNTDGRISAQLIRPSDRHDVALIKISVPDTVPKVELFDNYEAVQQGDAAVVLGYPAVTPPVYGLVKSQDVFNSGTQVKQIPVPTVSVGNIGNVLRGSQGDAGKADAVSMMGDVYQLTINSTGAGNSGGPVFDDKGRVIAIFFAGRQLDASVTFAVPIRYGKELMSVGVASR